MNIIATALASASIACTNCNATGWVEIPCPTCKGSGVVQTTQRIVYKVDKVYSPYNSMLPCRSCSKSLVRKDGEKGTGKKRITCKVCKGLKKIKK